MRRLAVVRVVVLAAVLAGVLAGCGDDDANGGAAGTTGEAPARTAFILEGEALCRDLKAQLDPLFVDFAATLPKRAAAYSQAVPLGRQFSQRFAAVQPPAEDKATIDAARRDYDDGLNRLEEGVRAAQAGDLAGSNAAFAAGFEAFGRSDAALRAYGFSVCAEPKTTRGFSVLSEAERKALAAEKQEYIKQADAVCEENQGRLEPLEEQTFAGGKVPDLAQWQSFLAGAIPIFQDTVTKVRALTPPAADRGTIDAMLADFDRALAAAQRANERAAAGDQAGFDAALDEVTANARRADDASRRYGFRHCREG